MSRVLLIPLFLLYGCVEPPERACDRVRFSWPNFLIEPSQDVSDAAGIQIEFSVTSDLAPGVGVDLLISQNGEERVAVGNSRSQENGAVAFSQITVPQGDIVMFLEAVDDCGVHRSGKRTYVWDGLGFPQCSLSLSAGPDDAPGGGSPVLSSEHDLDENEPGFQTRVRVEAGRPDMEVRLFVVEQATGDAQNFIANTGADGSIEQVLSLNPGEQAMRAVCLWEPENLRPSTPTWTYFVE